LKIIFSWFLYQIPYPYVQNSHISLALDGIPKTHLKAFVLSKITPPITAPSRPDKTRIKPISPIFSFSFYSNKQSPEF
jgi:hypothetical protein